MINNHSKTVDPPCAFVTPDRHTFSTTRTNGPERLPETIRDLDDPRLSPYRNLRHRETDDGFIAEGSLVVGRLLHSGLGVQSVLIHTGRESKYLPLIPDSVPVYLIDRELGKELAGYDFHRGVLAHGFSPTIEPLEKFRDSPQSSLALALMGLSDPENVGSLLRSAAALGVRDILLGPQTISPMTRRVIRVSMASVFRHRFYRFDNPVGQLRDLANAGIASIATLLDDTAIPLIDLSSAIQSKRRILMVGNEANGLPPEIAEAATHRSTLPMRNDTDSLNVGVASAIFLYELTRLRDADHAND
ncbi:rRNA methylase [Rhodopirellula baltica WH47]|uniref:rRNA methylase n=1 Tax=Rhodopirellula baltica WH47 TaxID=991778 RepID=F2AZ25_RHOBT|nr:rRNA methylase [Rhodopirellula baltica WH47]